MERKRGTFKVKLSAAPFRCLFDRASALTGGIFGAIKLDKSTHSLKN
jgi:hypothetical protein